MPVNSNELISIVSDLCRNEDIKVCITNSVYGGVITGFAAAIGGVVLGPAGVAVGGLFGGITAASMGSSFRSVAEILITDLSPAQKALLINRLNNVIRDVGPEDVVQLTALVLSNGSLRSTILEVVKGFVRNDLNLRLM